MKKRNKILISCFLVIVLLCVLVLSSFAEDLYRDPEEVEPSVVDLVKDPSANTIKTISAYKSPSRSVSSDFDENGVNSSFTDGQTYNISVCPQHCLFSYTGTYRGYRTCSIYNDTDLTFSLDVTDPTTISYLSGYTKCKLLSDSSDTYISQGVIYHFILSPGQTFVFSVYTGYTGSVYEHTLCDILFDPDPQASPSPFTSILTSVSDFSYSMLSSWTSLVTLIVSSWIFLVPLTMMLLVFFVLAIRKMIKGV